MAKRRTYAKKTAYGRRSSTTNPNRTSKRARTYNPEKYEPPTYPQYSPDPTDEERKRAMLDSDETIKGPGIGEALLVLPPGRAAKAAAGAAKAAGTGAKARARQLVETPGYKDAMLRDIKNQRAREALNTRPRPVSDATSTRIPRRTVTPQAPPTSGRSVRARLLRGRKR